MHRLFLLAAALGALAAPALAVQSCPSATDQSAYEILALRTEMVVLATKCSRDTEYNNYFVKRFQPVLQANYREVAAYFRRMYGGAGQGRMDTFATELVNVMSQQANTKGAEFCARASLIINEMNALQSLDQLPAYAAVKDLGPAGASMCPVAAVRPVANKRR
jgi:hypothetical protein